MADIRLVNDLESMLLYFSDKLGWDVDLSSFNIEDVTYDFSAAEVNLKNEEFIKIASLRQLRPLVDNQPWGIFAIEFDSKRFEVTALRKVLSGLIPKRRNANHAMWDKKNLLFLCFWGEAGNRTIGVAYFEDKDNGLPQIKIIYCNPRVEDPTQLDRFENKLSYLEWPNNPHNHNAWQEQWTEAFTTIYRQIIRDSATLITKLAIVAKHIQQQILDIIRVETANGYVHLLYEKFKLTLIHDMTIEQFADMYAQTITYGLFSARCMDDDETFDPQEAVKSIPNTNPFLKKLLQECLSQEVHNLSFDELELVEVVELLRNTNTKLILDDFNRQTGGGKEDPVIYFYEGFLNAYESEQKKRRGVYYTPQPVVKFIVQAVDDILKADFGFEDGIASIATKTISIQRGSKKKVNGFIKQVEDTEEVRAIQILDPATGTGTFLRQTILQIWENFKAKNRNNSETEVRRLWNEYVPIHLLPRLNGFELMMAPYAVAHMKLAMVLKETGYDFSGDERVKVFLTNSLEEGGSESEQLTLWDDPLAAESIAANKEKKNKGINIIIGNPPYSGESANKGDWIMNLMEDYKKEPGGLQKLQERNPKWLNDDYVKFIRYAQLYIDRSGAGIVGYICPHGFLMNPTFRGMRWSLIRTFDEIFICDLHGNSNRHESCPDGTLDENVFDIQQGVCVVLLIKKLNNKNTTPHIHHCDIYGTREYKYQVLNEKPLYSLSFDEVPIRDPLFLFKIQDYNIREKYNLGFSVTELFTINGVGITTAHDDFVIDEDPKILINRFSEFKTNKGDAELLHKEFNVKKKEGWDIIQGWRNLQSIQNLKSLIKPITYRPFDNKYIFYEDKLVWRTVRKVMGHFLVGPNLGLVTARSNKSDNCDHFYISRYMMETKCGERTTQSALFPLYIYKQTLDGMKCIPNFNDSILKNICDSLKMDFILNRDSNSVKNFTPIDLFDYIYAVFYSQSYRNTYKEFLKIDFPRVPYPTDMDMFWKLVKLGGQLRQLHLMENPELERLITEYPIRGNNYIERITYSNDCVFINNTQFFSNVPQVAWKFYIGGYQPAQKWLKDRNGRVLTEEDILHYQKIIMALTETDRLMKEIDEVFEF